MGYITRTNKYTGNPAVYKETEVWWDYSPMTPARCDGVVYLYEKKKYYELVDATGWRMNVNVRDHGIKPGGKQLELQYLDLQRRMFRNCLYKWPGDYLPYDIDLLPEKYKNWRGDRLHLTIDTSGANIIGEGEGTVLNFRGRGVGIQATGGIAARDFRLSDITLNMLQGEAALGDGIVDYTQEFYEGADGKPDYGNPNPDYGRKLGEPSLQHDRYRCNAVNLHNRGVLHRVKIVGGSHGVSVLGAEVRPSGLPFEILGGVDNKGGWSFTPDDPAHTQLVQFGWEIEIQGIKTLSGTEPTHGYRAIGLQGLEGGKPAKKVVATVTPRGGKMIADACRIDDCEIGFCIGAGISIAGSDGNQCYINGGFIHDTGWHAIYGISTLGEYPILPMCHRSGTRFNTHDEYGNPIHVPIGHISIGNNLNARSLALAPYREGDSGKDIIGPQSISLGGVDVGGITGKGLYISGRGIYNASVGNGDYGQRYTVYQFQEGQPFVSGPNPRNGAPAYGFGNPDPAWGQDFRLSGEHVEGGQSIYDPFSQSTRKIAQTGFHSDALYAGPVGRRSFATMEQFLRRLLEEEAWLNQKGELVAPAIKRSDVINIYDDAGPLAYLVEQTGFHTNGTLVLQPLGIGRGPKLPPADSLTKYADGWRWEFPTGGAAKFGNKQWLDTI